MPNDKRLSPRVTLDVQVNYASRAIAHAKDISQGGICLVTEEPLTKGKIFSLSFNLPGQDRSLNCFGKVMWSRPASSNLHENGISFWDIDSKIQKLITEYLSRDGI
jgi:Tfp pilus assembly protein PilZ